MRGDASFDKESLVRVFALRGLAGGANARPRPPPSPVMSVLHPRDGSLLRKKQEQWAREKGESSSHLNVSWRGTGGFLRGPSGEGGIPALPRLSALYLLPAPPQSPHQGNCQLR